MAIEALAKRKPGVALEKRNTIISASVSLAAAAIIWHQLQLMASGAKLAAQAAARRAESLACLPHGVASESMAGRSWRQRTAASLALASICESAKMAAWPLAIMSPEIRSDKRVQAKYQ
jgi:hypothetical protein